jgi:hypothetical protein
MSVSGCGDEDDRGGGNLTVNNCEAGSFIMCLVQMGTKLQGATNFRFACSETFYPLAIWSRFVYPFDITSCKKLVLELLTQLCQTDICIHVE